MQQVELPPACDDELLLLLLGIRNNSCFLNLSDDGVWSDVNCAMWVDYFVEREVIELFLHNVVMF